MNKLNEEGTFKIKRTERKELDTVLIKSRPLRGTKLSTQNESLCIHLAGRPLARLHCRLKLTNGSYV